MSGDFDVDRIISKLTKAPPDLLTPDEANDVLEHAKQLFIKEENCIKLQSPIIVVGDIHGQLYDLHEIFRIEPPPPESQYLFLGDYVDRGYYSLEVLMYLLCLKIKSPSRVHMLRGNHESCSITQTYGFYNECTVKYHDTFVYQKCCELFNYLPLAAIIDDRVFGVHGGLSPSISLIEQIGVVDRFREPFLDGPLPDLLWADPSERVTGFSQSKRGMGYLFGADVTKRFAHLNRLTHITRAHQLVMRGYELFCDGLLSTVWSAPNYMYRSGNLASVMKVSDDGKEFSMRFNIFDAVPARERTVPDSTELISSYFL